MLNLIPERIKDLSNKTLLNCAKEAFNIDLKPFVFFVFDKVDKKFLPLLAEMFHIAGNEGWNLAKTEKQKRELLKNAFKMHKYKGTKKALKDVLKYLDLEGSILEWFDYDGEPYYFKVVLRVFDRTLDEETEDMLLALIYEFKNTRSWLEKIEMYLASKVEVTVFTRLLCGEVITIKPCKPGNKNIKGNE